MWFIFIVAKKCIVFLHSFNLNHRIEAYTDMWSHRYWALFISSVSWYTQQTLVFFLFIVNEPEKYSYHWNQSTRISGNKPTQVCDGTNITHSSACHVCAMAQPHEYKSTTQISSRDSFFIMIRSPSNWSNPSEKTPPLARSRKVPKPRDWYPKLLYHSETRQAHQQHCCWSACQIPEWSDNSKHKPCGPETLRDPTERRPFGYRDGALYLRKKQWHNCTNIYSSCDSCSPWLKNVHISAICQSKSQEGSSSRYTAPQIRHITDNRHTNCPLTLRRSHNTANFLREMLTADTP